MVRDWPRDPFPRQQLFAQQCLTPNGRHSSFQQERHAGDVEHRPESFPQNRYAFESSEQGRFPEAFDMHRRQPPMQIDAALRSHCGIAAKQYFVAAISDDGKPMTFTSPGQRLNDATIRQFFDLTKFQNVMARIGAGADPILEDSFGAEEMTLHRNSSRGHHKPSDRRHSVLDDWDASGRQGRKRPRPRHPIHEDDDVPMTVSSRRGIKISDSDSVWTFYEQRFKNCQQTACKLIAKAWVKAVEPKKQSTHPYTGSDEKAPDWWPKPWGPTKDDKVRHKEPDHLYKRERVHLLAHILRLVVEPTLKQHNDLQKLSLNVKKLEETTHEALSSFFMDNETNAKKKPYLNEIFKMARQEERFKNGEIDGSTEVYVMAEDKIPDNYTSDNEDGPLSKEEDDDDVARPKANAQQHCALQTPSTGPPVSGQALHGSHGPPFMGELPVRGNSFNPAILPTEVPSQPHAFVDSDGIPVTGQAAVAGSNSALALDMVTSPHNASRRPSVFSEYASPGGPSLYNQQWQQPGSAGPTQPPLYSFTQPHSAPSQTSFISPVPMNPPQPFIGDSFDEPGRPDFDANGGPIYRSEEMAHAAVNQHQGYYVSSDVRPSIRILNQVGDNVPRSQI